MSNPGSVPSQEPSPAWVNWVVLGVVVGLMFLVFRFRPFGGPDAKQYPIVNRPLPILELKGLVASDEVVTLPSVEGQVSLVCFWGPWAPDSMELVARLADIAASPSGDTKVRLLAVACSKPGVREDLARLKSDVEGLREQLHLTIPVYIDPGRHTQSGLDALRARASDPTRLPYPTTLLLDRKGFIRAVWEGSRPNMDEEVRQAVAEVLER